MIPAEWIDRLRGARFLSIASLGLVAGMLVACLWPFHSPKNEVQWAPGGRGIEFGRHGVLLDMGTQTMRGDPALAWCSIELWVEPGTGKNDGTIFAIYADATHHLSIQQWMTGLVVRSEYEGHRLRKTEADSYADDVFKPHRPVLITIRSGDFGTEVFANGTRRATRPNFRITNKMLSGKLIVGSGPTGANSWKGIVRGLAIYSRGLSAEKIVQHCQRWEADGQPGMDVPDSAAALYLFNEGRGSLIHSSVRGRGDLYIPERFVVPVKGVLQPPTLDNPDDIALNVIGFMPLGFTLCGYFLATGKSARTAMALTAILCALLSLGIETFQIVLPTRDSDTTDILTNLAGGVVGALGYVWANLRLFGPRVPGVPAR